ncbi:hypothetical protein ACFSUK_12960 [Sphingobium scionense]
MQLPGLRQIVELRPDRIATIAQRLVCDRPLRADDDVGARASGEFGDDRYRSTPPGRISSRIALAGMSGFFT